MNEIHIVRPSGVAHETIDGETVVIDMQSGSYYRLEGAASIAWEHLSSGASGAQLCLDLRRRFTAGPDAIETQVEGFIQSLRDFGLIVPHDRSGSSASQAPASGMAAFPGLAVHRFTDLQELFWIDPVHEVDDTGWPTTRSS